MPEANQSKNTGVEYRQLRQKAVSLLSDQMDFWLEKAWDNDVGGFIECVDKNGTALPSVARRTRVAARQIFSFSSAIELGIGDPGRAKTLVRKGLEFLFKTLRKPSGGWPHTYDENGSSVDDREDLYDHAFILLAGATAHRVNGEPLGLEISNNALLHIEANWKDKTWGGYLENNGPINERRANPHMHLLEAFLALHLATAEPKYLRLAAEIVELFTDRFFDPRSDIVREFYRKDWTPAPTGRGAIFEPGHHYEWATLLYFFEHLTGKDTSVLRQRIMIKARESGTDKHGVFCFNEVSTDAGIINANKRLWPQLEKFRAMYLHGASKKSIEAFFEAMLEAYFKPARPGLFIDEIDRSGLPLSKPVPASMLYHLMTALSPLIMSEALTGTAV